MSEPITNTEIIGYLQAHLISLLKTNSGGKNIPQLWLVRDDFGDITRAFELPAEAEGVGGVTAPAGVVQGSKIFRPKEQAVIAFLMAFSLSLPEAQSIIDSIGMEP
jgi:hypothetical protein